MKKMVEKQAAINIETKMDYEKTRRLERLNRSKVLVFLYKKTEDCASEIFCKFIYEEQ